MTHTKNEPTWVSEYDYPSRRVSVTLADAARVGHHWSGIRKAASMSDPGGDFDVYVAFNPRDSSAYTPDLAARIVKVVARLNDEGDFKNPHPDFDTFAIGSPTIWPYKVAGERFGLAHWMWWTAGPVFRHEPRSWAEAARDHQSRSGR